MRKLGFFKGGFSSEERGGSESVGGFVEGIWVSRREENDLFLEVKVEVEVGVETKDSFEHVVEDRVKEEEEEEERRER